MFKQIGDVYWDGTRYSIGHPTDGPDGKIKSKMWKTLSYLLEHLNENISYEEIAKVSGSKNPQSLIVNLRYQMGHSRYFGFARGSKDHVRLRIIDSESLSDKLLIQDTEK